MRIGFGSHQNTIDNYFGPSIVELSVLSVFFFLGGGGWLSGLSSRLPGLTGRPRPEAPKALKP